MSVYLLDRCFTMPYLLPLFIFAKCVMQGGDITSDVTGQFQDLVLRVQYLNGLCIRVVADRKRPWNLGSKFPRSEYFERKTTSTTTITTITTIMVVVVVVVMVVMMLLLLLLLITKS